MTAEPSLAPEATKRLQELREEYDAGMKAMQEIQRKQDELRATLLRISGAIQVLEDLLSARTADQAKPDE